MRPICLAAAALMIGALFPSVVLASYPQEAPAVQEPAPLPKAKLSEEDIKAFQPLFDAGFSFGRSEEDAKTQQKLAKAHDVFIEAVKKYETTNGVSSVCGDDDSWRKILNANYVSRLKEGKEKSPAGKGTIKEASIEIVYQGEVYRYDYAYILPSNYSVEESWPMLVCLHDKGSSGPEYLRAVWDDDKEIKQLRDRFILVAPTIRDKTPSGDSRENRGRKLAQKYLGWFDRLHVWSIILPIKDLRERFNCDAARTSIEGTGLGGQMAVDAGVLLGSTMFASVVVRNAQPKNINLVPGLSNTPTMFVYRDGGVVGSGDALKYWDDLKAMTEREAMQSVTVKVMPAVDKLTPKMMAGQATEPLKDATKDLLEWLSERRLEAYPAKLRFLTNNTDIKRSAHLQLNRINLEGGGAVVDCTLEMDKATNTVRLTGAGFYSFTLFLNDSVLDLDKSIDIYLNGQLLERRTQKRDLQYMLKGMRNNSTVTNRVYTAGLQIEVPQAQDAPAEGAGEAKEGEKKVGDEKK